MSEEMRTQILLRLEIYAESEPHSFMGDGTLAKKIGADIKQVRRQMDILEIQGLIQPANSHDGNAARISPQGSLIVEPLKKSWRDFGMRSRPRDQSNIPADQGRRLSKSSLLRPRLLQRVLGRQPHRRPRVKRTGRQSGRTNPGGHAGGHPHPPIMRQSPGSRRLRGHTRIYRRLKLRNGSNYSRRTCGSNLYP
jgi:hypothetical protein